MKKILFFLLIISLLSDSLSAQINLPLGLRAYYPFAGNANDVSGNNNNPVFNNATLTADRFGNPNSAYRFNGSNSYMRIPNSPTLNMPSGQISLSVWVKPMGYWMSDCKNNAIIMKLFADYQDGNYSLRFVDWPNGCTNNNNYDNEKFGGIIGSYGSGGGTGGGTIANTPTVQLNQWYSVVYTNDGVKSKIYVNCILRDSAINVGSANLTNASDLFFGHLNSTQFPYWLNGDLDEVRIYDRALNQEEVNVLGGCAPLNPCDTWLRTTNASSFVEVGDLDVSGNKITVEATFNRSTPPVASSYGFLVSKHTNSSDLNYALWPGGCSVTTTTGQKFATENCGIELNKTYHVAMVYDGATLKFYRNGFLHSQTPTTGNLVLNNLLTRINSDALVGGFPFNGYTNEVRIWNVARTQAELRTYMNTSLPNPTTQTGLLGYYTFNNLLNKQGNPAYNGVLSGTGTINNTNPNCNYVADSCGIVTTTGISNIINDYTAVLNLDKCKNVLTVSDASKFNAGDTVLLIQMKGAVIDSTNTANFGTITDYKNAGNYEFNYVKAKNGNSIELKNGILRGYDIPNGKVQLIRVPYYQNVTVTGTLTAKAWDGTTGGVLAFNVADTLNLNADIDVSGKGFRGATPISAIATSGINNQTDFTFPANANLGSRKGEGIADVSENLIFCRGPLSSGGGGGNSHNAGGGGGANAGTGGRGGNEWAGASTVLSNGGLGGKQHTYSPLVNKIFMGSGGGAGHTDNGTGTTGGNGGGIVIFKANIIKPNSQKIISNGLQGGDCININVCADGVSGGGGGGTLLLSAQAILTNFAAQTNGGKGGDNNISGPNAHGTGGGGGGGSLLVNSPTLLGSINYTSNGGAAGRAFNHGNSTYGASSGNNGISAANFIIPTSTIPFKPNIDSVRFTNTAICNNFNFLGQAFTNTVGIQSWQWFFGDGGTANTQNASHTYPAANTTYTVKLVVTDLNGCKDSISKNITTPPAFIADAGNDTSLCIAPSVTVQLNASAGGITYSWTPAAVLNNPNIRNPIATISASTTFYVTVTNAAGCSSTDSVKVSLLNAINPSLSITTSTPSICKGNAATFVANYVNGGSNPIFEWYKNNVLVGTYSNTYTDNTLNNGDVIKCKLTSNLSCASPNNVESNTITITVVNAASNMRYTTLNTLQNQNLQLQARTFTGATYAWSPTIGLNNGLISNPVFNFNQSKEYLITITTPIGCTTIDTQLVVITGKKGLYVPKAFSPNNSGANDRLYPILVGIKQLLYFKVYNRWGILVFQTNSGNPALGWDGTYKGQPQPVETYTWVAEAIDIDNIRIKKSGSTLLIR